MSSFHNLIVAISLYGIVITLTLAHACSTLSRCSVARIPDIDNSATQVLYLLGKR